MDTFRRAAFHHFCFQFNLVEATARSEFFRVVCDRPGSPEPYALALDAVLDDQALHKLETRAQRLRSAVLRYVVHLHQRFGPLLWQDAGDEPVLRRRLLRWIGSLEPAPLQALVYDELRRCSMLSYSSILHATSWVLLRAAHDLEMLPGWVSLCREHLLSQADLEEAVGIFAGA